MYLGTSAEPLRRETTRLLRAGVDQGRFRVDLNIARVIDAFVGAVYPRLLLGQSLNASWARALGDTLVNGCLPQQP
jgi:hypothetical protein